MLTIWSNTIKRNLIIVNPLSLIIDQFIKRVGKEYPDLSFVYDPSLQIETSVRGLRTFKNAYKLEKDASLPLLAYSRSVFRPDDNQRWQSFGQIITSGKLVGDDYLNARIMPGSFDFNFRLYVDNAALLEYYESAYTTQSFLCDLQRERMDFDNGDGVKLLEDWPITYQWQPLDDFQYERENVINMSFGGQGKFRTSLVVMEDTNYGLLAGINLKIENKLNENHVWYHKYFDIKTQKVVDVVV